MKIDMIFYIRSNFLKAQGKCGKLIQFSKNVELTFYNWSSFFVHTIQ